MSHINFDFLTESFLFGYGLEDNFSALSDYELEKELNRYREYVISNMGEICREIIFDSRKIAVTIESFSERPREELLKQLALYVDVVTISDPLFELTEKKSNSTKVMAEYYGMKCVYFPYLGKNDHPADITNVEKVVVEEITLKETVISSMFLKETGSLIMPDDEDDIEVFKYAEKLPIALNGYTNLYEYADFCYTNMLVDINNDKLHKLYKTEDKILEFY